MNPFAFFPGSGICSDRRREQQLAEFLFNQSYDVITFIPVEIIVDLQFPFSVAVAGQIDLTQVYIKQLRMVKIDRAVDCVSAIDI